MLLAEKLKTLLYIIAQSVPFKPNYTKIGRDLNMHRNAVSDLMIWLAKAGLINILRNETQGISLLGKVNKIYLSNPNIAYLLSGYGTGYWKYSRNLLLRLVESKTRHYSI